MVPKPKEREPQDLMEHGKWMDASALMARVEAVRLQALTLARDRKDGSSRLEAATAVHNALLATMCFGYLPPLRDCSVLLTITAPPHQGCVHPDCQHRAAGCLGNRVYKQKSTGKWVLHVPHHKNTRVWQGTAIKVELPAEVAELLEHHLSWAHRALTGMCDKVAPTLFVNTNTGAPLKPQEVSKVWSKTVLEGSGVHFGPQTCRSIFAVGVRDSGHAHPGMAMVMGNSTPTWDAVYDRHFKKREVGEAMQHMSGWRQKMLEQAGRQEHRG